MSNYDYPVLKRDTTLSHDISDYLGSWDSMTKDQRDEHIIELCRGRCPILGVPGPGEELRVARISQKELGDLEDAPWSYIALMWSPKEERNMYDKFTGNGNNWIVAHWDVLDEDKGFEVLDIERRVISHADLDFYTRASSTSAKAASEWHQKTCAAWEALLKSLFEFTMYMDGASDNVNSLGFDTVKEWANAVGIKFPLYSKMSKVLAHGSSIGELWHNDLHISPHVLSDFIAKVPEEDFNAWLPKLKDKAAFRPILGGDGASDVDGLMKEIAEEYPKEPKPKHFLVFPGEVQYTEFERAEGLPQDPEGLKVLVVEGKLSWKGKMSGEKLGLPFNQ